MTSELSLHTGGEDSVYLLVELNDKDRPVLTNPGFVANQRGLNDIKRLSALAIL